MSKITIENFIKSEETELLLGYTSPKEILDILKSLGYIFDNDMNTNGWQVDFWLKCTNAENKIIAFTGSWYYGNYKLVKE